MKGERNMGKKLPNPGSDEAIKQGCIWPVFDNCRGRGSRYGEGVFFINRKCPLHGDQLDKGVEEKKA